MTGHTRIGGTWKSVESASVKIGGAWKTVDKGFTKVNGTWKEWFSADSPPPILLGQNYMTSPDQVYNGQWANEGIALGKSTFGANFTINFASTLQQGDLILLLVAQAEDRPEPVNTPTGYTPIGTEIYVEEERCITAEAFYKFVGPTPDTSVTIVNNQDSSTSTTAAAMLVRGVDPNYDFSNFFYQSGNNSINPVFTPALTSQKNNSVLATFGVNASTLGDSRVFRTFESGLLIPSIAANASNDSMIGAWMESQAAFAQGETMTYGFYQNPLIDGWKSFNFLTGASPDGVSGATYLSFQIALPPA